MILDSGMLTILPYIPDKHEELKYLGNKVHGMDLYFCNKYNSEVMKWFPRNTPDTRKRHQVFTD